MGNKVGLLSLSLHKNARKYKKNSSHTIAKRIAHVRITSLKNINNKIASETTTTQRKRVVKHLFLPAVSLLVEKPDYQPSLFPTKNVVAILQKVVRMIFVEGVGLVSSKRKLKHSLET